MSANLRFLTVALVGQPQYEAAYPGCQWLRGDIDGNAAVNFDDLNGFIGLLSTVSGTPPWVKYTWDAENRLTVVEPQQPAAGAKKVQFKYDYLGRRVEKMVSTYASGTWSVTDTRRFVWNDWLMLMELDGSGNVLRKYTWGLDLGGQSGSASASGLSAAGGIGGLLAVEDSNGTPGTSSDDLNYVYFYDANGNVGQTVDLAAGSAPAAITAKYEYDPYGKVIAQAGSYADGVGVDNPMTFSTKYFDAETGLGYWGYRYYSPKLGRWINRVHLPTSGLR